MFLGGMEVKILREGDIDPDPDLEIDIEVKTEVEIEIEAGQGRGLETVDLVLLKDLQIQLARKTFLLACKTLMDLGIYPMFVVSSELMRWQSERLVTCFIH